MAQEGQNNLTEIVYFVKILAGICVLGLLVNVLFHKALFLAMCIIFASMLGLLLVQFEMSISGATSSKLNFLGILKKLFHFRNLLFMMMLTGWVFDIYINNYDKIQNEEMPPTFYKISNAFIWLLVCQVMMVVSNFVLKKKEVQQMSKGKTDSVFTKMGKLYSAQSSSLNAIFNVVNFVLVIILYITAEMFVTDG